jgi:hypothetical protein
MLFDRINDVCTKNGTNITSLCKEVTGSSGNLATWKKDKIRPDWLREICLKFDVSSDYLLDLPVKAPELTQAEREVLARYDRLEPDYQIKALSYMIDLYEKQVGAAPVSEGE